MSTHGQLCAVIAITLLPLQSVYAKNTNFNIERILKMQTEQAALIAKGIRSGQLTNNEQKRLLNEQRVIRIAKKNFLKDKVLTRFESNTLIRLLKQARRNIDSELSNNKRRPKMGKHGRLHR